MLLVGRICMRFAVPASFLLPHRLSLQTLIPSLLLPRHLLAISRRRSTSCFSRGTAASNFPRQVITATGSWGEHPRLIPTTRPPNDSRSSLNRRVGTARGANFRYQALVSGAPHSGRFLGSGTGWERRRLEEENMGRLSAYKQVCRVGRISI